MKKIIFVFVLFAFAKAYAQGPPITADKPIMLGGGSKIVKTLTEIRYTEEGDFLRIPIMMHYLPTSNTLVAVHVPYVSYHFSDQRGEGSLLGDINILAKYQFYRKDGTGKSFRMVVKTLQTLPTGDRLDIEGISTGEYQGYYAVVAGYESLKYGLSGEIGYNMSPGGNYDEFAVKAGVGLPLLKPTYPVNQLNLYFEYGFYHMPEREQTRLDYSQGFQYARGRWTWETAVTVPLVQDAPDGKNRKYSILLGTRYIF